MYQKIKQCNGIVFVNVGSAELQNLNWPNKFFENSLWWVKFLFCNPTSGLKSKIGKVIKASLLNVKIKLYA